ncbi:MAG: acetylxylan esterase [Planctomycetales bacterium]|nr:acetylxylan esterase [Planctomycetales bacterium]
MKFAVCCLFVFHCVAYPRFVCATERVETREATTSLRDLDTNVLAADRATLSRMLSNDVQARLREANGRESAAWQGLHSRAEWEAYREPRLRALRQSLGRTTDVPRDLHVRTTRTLTGDGFRVENILFESRPGLIVTANLYLPATNRTKGPGVLIFHSHHSPKTQSELQDMGILWAKQGATMLVMDQLGHGERRQHPFKTAADFPASFRVGRQDYYFRYNSNLQLSVIGESLMGWMAWDMQRAVDLLLSRPEVDPKKIALLGSVAGGGDPAAVTGAIDERIAVVVPFNFGGPQPETKYPLPDDAETWFNYAGGGSWESTRNLRQSASGGFLPWVIVGATAPRRLIYGHEFAWDRDRDPVWKRLETIYGWYDARDRLAFTTGFGGLSGQAPDASHCNNIGPEHRRRIHEAFAKWFDLKPPPAENTHRFSADELACLTTDAVRQSPPRSLHEVARERGLVLGEETRQRRIDLSAANRRQELRQLWAKQLGGVEPREPRLTAVAEPARPYKPPVAPGVNVTVERFAVAIERDIVVPGVLLLPSRTEKQRLPFVVAVAQAGKQAFLRERADDIAALLKGGTAVCLCDLRGTGETRPGDDSRGRTSSSTSLSASEWMLGETMLGARLRDLRTLLLHLRTRSELDPRRCAIWGDSFAPVNAPDRVMAVPWDAPNLPHTAEPLGGVLALLCALFEDNISAVYARGGLATYVSVLDDAFLYVPHDVIVPDAVSLGDLDEVAVTLVPRPLRLVNPVDARNRRLPLPLLSETYGHVRLHYETHKAANQLQLESSDKPEPAAEWLLEQVRKN